MRKTVFFDLGNVLLYFSHERMCSQIAQYCNASPEKVKNIIFQEQWGDKYERGTINSRDLHHAMSATFGTKIEFQGLMKAMSDIFEPNASLIPVVKELKANKVELIILSNTCEAHFNYVFTHFPILHLFDSFVLSYEIGARKPESKIFECALERASSERKNCFYTDDIEEFVASARNLGLDAELYTSADQLRKHLVNRNFLG